MTKNDNRIDHRADKTLLTLKTTAVIEASEFHKWPLENPTNSPVASTDKPLDHRSEAKLKLLRAVVEYPMRPSREYSSLAHISPNTLIKIRPEMVKDGLICEHKLDMVTGRGRSRIALSASEAGKKLMTDSGKV